MIEPPLQVIDTFLLDYNLGDVLLLVAVLGAVGLLVRRTNKLFGLHVLAFGLLFLLLPQGMLDPSAGSVFSSAAMYKFVGIAMLALAPVVYAVSRE